MAHGAMRAVAARQVGEARGLHRAVGMQQVRRDPRTIVHEGLQLDLPLHRHAQALQLLLQQPLGLVLRDEQSEAEAAAGRVQ